MKKFILLLTMLIFIFSAFADETLENIQTKKNINSNENINLSSDLPKDQQNIEKNKQSYRYFKVGSSFMVFNAGVGYKFRNLKKLRGNNIDLNINLPYINMVRSKCFLPTLKYSHLWYKKPQKQSSYFGLGFEGGLVFESTKIKGFYPNIELFWGKEREEVKFTQIGVNVVPFLASALITAAFVSDSQNLLARFGVGALVGSAVGITYTIGF